MLHCCCFLCASFKKCGNAFVTHCMCWPRLPVLFSSRAGGGGVFCVLKMFVCIRSNNYECIDQRLSRV